MGGSERTQAVRRGIALVVIVACATAGSVLVGAGPAAAGSAPVVTVHPQSVVVNGGFTLRSVAVGDPVPTVQWQESNDQGATWVDRAGLPNGDLYAGLQPGVPEARYRAVWTNAEGSATSSVAIVTRAVLPAVTAQPQSGTWQPGETVTLSADAEGLPAPSVRWQQSNDGTTWTDIAGTTSRSYAFVASASTSLRSYRAVFTNLAGTRSTAAAQVTVPSAPVVVVHPSAAVSGNAGATVSLKAEAFGTEVPAVQWERSSDGGATWSDIAAATAATVNPSVSLSRVSSTYAFTVQAGDAGARFRARFTNSLGTSRTNASTFTLTHLPVITSNPSSVSVVPGAPVTFAVGYASGSPVSIAWQRWNGQAYADISGATTASYSITATEALDGARYRARVTGTGGAVTSAPADLTVTSAPVITSHPADASAAPPTSSTLIAYATGGPKPTVSWQVSTDGGATWAAASGTSALVGSAPPYQAWIRVTRTVGDPRVRLYRAVFTNASGTATTRSAVVTTTGPPVILANPSNARVDTGDVATFTVAGANFFEVWWQRSACSICTWTDIAGATSTTLSIPTTPSSNMTRYRAQLRNVDGTTTSAVASLVLKDVLPVVVQAPQDLTRDGQDVIVNPWCFDGGGECIALGRSATFTASSGGTATSVQWETSADGGATWTAVAGATSDSYTISPTTKADHLRQVRAVYTNEAGSKPTPAATLSVRSQPTVTADPQSTTVVEGETATFTADGEGYPMQVVWYTAAPGSDVFEPIPGANGLTLSVPDVSLADAGRRYQLGLESTFSLFPNDYSARAVLTVIPAAMPVAQPVEPLPLVADGAPVAMSFSAAGTPAPDAVFQVSNDGFETWFEVPDATVEVEGDRTTITVEIAAPIEASGWQTRAVFTNAAGSVTTDPLTLRVGRAPSADPVEQMAPVADGTPVAMSFSATGTPAPDAVFQVSNDGFETWFEVPDATVEVEGDRTTITVEIAAPIEASGWQTRAVFTNELGSVTTEAFTLLVSE